MRSDVTTMLLSWSDGDEQALDQLLPVIYDELKRMAHNRMRNERADHTLDTTGLVHEAFLRLVDINEVEWKDRSHFLAMASRMVSTVGPKPCGYCSDNVIGTLSSLAARTSRTQRSTRRSLPAIASRSLS